MLSAYPALQSKYTRDSIVAKYKAIDTAERKKREIVKMVSGMIFKGVTLSSLEVDDKSYKVHFTCKDAQVAKRLNLLATKNKLKTSAISGSHDLKIEGTL
jgi:tRNA(Phe) wybutosine-synthesizing methylase Tyw3